MYVNMASVVSKIDYDFIISSKVLRQTVQSVKFVG